MPEKFVANWVRYGTMLPEGATMHDHHAYLNSSEKPLSALVELESLPKFVSASV